MKYRVWKQDDEKRQDTILRISEELVMWHGFMELCKPGYRAAMKGPDGDYGYMPDMDVRMDEKTAPKWRSFAASMIDQCETRLKELTQA